MLPPKRRFLQRARAQQKSMARARDAMRKVVRRKRAYDMDAYLGGFGNNIPDTTRRRIINTEINNARDMNAANQMDEAYAQGKRLKRLDQHMRGKLKPVYFT